MCTIYFHIFGWNIVTFMARFRRRRFSCIGKPSEWSSVLTSDVVALRTLVSQLSQFEYQKLGDVLSSSLNIIYQLTINYLRPIWYRSKKQMQIPKQELTEMLYAVYIYIYILYRPDHIFSLGVDLIKIFRHRSHMSPIELYIYVYIYVTLIDRDKIL